LFLRGHTGYLEGDDRLDAGTHSMGTDPPAPRGATCAGAMAFIERALHVPAWILIALLCAAMTSGISYRHQH